MPIDPAVELARRRASGGGSDMDPVSPSRWAGPRSPGSMHGDGNHPQLPVPMGGHIDQATDFGGLPYDGSLDLETTPALAGKTFDSMTAEERDARLKEYLSHGEDTVRKRRDLQVEKDSLELEKKRTFFQIAVKAAIGFIVLAALIVTILVALFVWVSIKDGTMTDTSIITSIFSSFTEIFRIIFGNGI